MEYGVLLPEKMLDRDGHPFPLIIAKYYVICPMGFINMSLLLVVYTVVTQNEAHDWSTLVFAYQSLMNTGAHTGCLHLKGKIT